MANQNTHPSPENIMKIGSGFWASKILLTAVNFHLFTKIAEKKSMSAAELKNELGLQCTYRNVYDFWTL